MMTTDLCFKCSNKDSILCTICGITKDGAREHFKQKPVTNADRIRAMTDEELTEWLDEGFRRADWCDISKFPNNDCLEVPCFGCIIDWLKQEVKG